MPTLYVTNFNIIVALLGGWISLFGLVSYLCKENFYLSEAREWYSSRVFCAKSIEPDSRRAIWWRDGPLHHLGVLSLLDSTRHLLTYAWRLLVDATQRRHPTDSR
jgi:hypothetical protein